MPPEELSNGESTTEERPGWSRPCPSCTKRVAYTSLRVVGGLEPFLHCTRCSSFTLRGEDAAAAQRLAGPDGLIANGTLRALYASIWLEGTRAFRGAGRPANYLIKVS